MIENRKNYRLPFRSKYILGNEDRVIAGNTANMSAGGLFVQTLTPFMRDTKLKCVFLINNNVSPIVTQAVVKRVVATSSNIDEKPGIGIEFFGAESKDLLRVEQFMEENRRRYELASTLLSSGEPDLNSLQPLLENMHLPNFSDLGETRFYIERILASIELGDQE